MVADVYAFVSVSVWAGAQTKLEAGVQLSHHMFSYGERPNDYDSVSKCAWPPLTNFFF